MRIYQTQAQAYGEKGDGEARFEAKVMEPMLELGLPLVLSDALVDRSQLLKVEKQLVEDRQGYHLNYKSRIKILQIDDGNEAHDRYCLLKILLILHQMRAQITSFLRRVLQEYAI